MGKCKTLYNKQNQPLTKRTLRAIHNKKYNSHTDPLFKQSIILKVSGLHKLDRSCCLCMIIQMGNYHLHLMLFIKWSHILNINTTRSCLTRATKSVFLDCYAGLVKCGTSYCNDCYDTRSFVIEFTISSSLSSFNYFSFDIMVVLLFFNFAAHGYLLAYFLYCSSYHLNAFQS